MWEGRLKESDRKQNLLNSTLTSVLYSNMTKRIGPLFLGIGGQRCGTTWIFECLKEHPQVRVAKEKEIHYFSYWYHKGQEWYEKHYPEVSTKLITGEFSTSYLYDYHAPERVVAYNADTKIIVCLRDPVARAYSQHKHETRMMTISGKNLDFKEGLKNNLSYIEHGRYRKYLARWMECIPRTNILVLFYENIEENPYAFVTKLYRFCDLEETYTPRIVEKRVNTSDVAKDIEFYRRVRRLSKQARRAHVGPVIEWLKSLGVDVALFSEKSETKINERLGYDNRVKDSLRKRFEKENESLFSLIGENCSSWG